MSIVARSMGRARPRVDAGVKVRGEARYACEYPLDRIAYVFAIQSTIAKGRIVAIDGSSCMQQPGVLALVTHENAPRLHADGPTDLAVMQSDRVVYHGQIIGAVVAETLDVARHAASLVRIDYEQEPHAVQLDTDRADLYTPQVLNGGYVPETFKGDVAAGLASAQLKLEHAYETPTLHNNPMEMHATTADWRDGAVTLYDSNQGAYAVRAAVAKLVGIPPENVRVISSYVGGGFGSKGQPHSHVLVAIMASQATGRPAKFMLTRQQMFSLAGHRTPTHQRVTLGADRDGRLISVAHDTIEQSAAVQEFAEQTGVATRVMYAAPNLRTTHRLATCDVPVPSWMRAPGECPGMFALESAIDEMAIACGVDPIAFRVTNDAKLRPEDDRPFSSRNLIACFREGARRFGWSERRMEPRTHRDGRSLVGLGVAASVYPVYFLPCAARARAEGNGTYRVAIGAVDIGQGAWTVLQQIAADALEVPLDRVTIEIGTTDFPHASVAGGSSGTTSWGSAITDACQKLRRTLEGTYGGEAPAGGITVEAETKKNPAMEQFAMYAFGAQFVEARVDIDTGEIHVPRMCGVFAAGRIINPTTARSQFIGGMTMGLSMALFERSVIDAQFGDYANHDFAGYHIATHADVGSIDIAWIDEDDPHVNAMGSKGIGEIGIVGTAAAVANAAYNATGIRVRDLPLTLDTFIGVT